jgi:hypothetical protein
MSKVLNIIGTILTCLWLAVVTVVVLTWAFVKVIARTLFWVVDVIIVLENAR